MLNASSAPVPDPLIHLADATLPSPRAVLLAGPLGSGKTTLLNHLLERSAGSAAIGSFVVIENDIGARNTDAARLAARPEDVLAITAGCICCNDLHSLKAAIGQIQAAGSIRTIFIETTGIASPGSVKDLLHTAGIPTRTIVTVDVKHFDRNRLLRRDADTVPHADIVALTWWDGSVPPRTISRTIAAIRSENDTAPLLFVSPTGAPAAPDSIAAFRTLHHGLDEPGPRSETFEPTGIVTHAPIAELRVPLALTRPSLAQHRTFSITLAPPPGMSPAELREAVERGTGKARLLRAKGHLDGLEFDCTHGDWQFCQRDRGPRRNTITIMSDYPLHSGNFPGLTCLTTDSAESLDLSDPGIHGRAVELVRELILRIPADVVAGDRLITETEAGEAWRYVSRPGFPAELRETFFHALLDFYLRQHEALLSGQFASSPALPYYQREVGYNLSWFTIDCGAELHRWGLHDRVTSLRPCSLYFEGLAAANTALHIGSFREGDTPYLLRRFAALAEELGDARGRSLAAQAIENCTRLSLDGSWHRANALLLDWERATGSGRHDPQDRSKN